MACKNVLCPNIHLMPKDVKLIGAIALAYTAGLFIVMYSGEKMAN